ncbi:hypothetical protein N7535_009564 [Penicillium sp. DV-2018c]|nr:hypothetical protein N7461_002046 [Penicillium sp. DV-2018c]KAJ5559336.1 hypothetical protein N7535_009564 [Penicillium sp. DV-2018c]
MDPRYDNMVGIDQPRHNHSLSMSRSMRVVKQERSLDRDQKPRKQRKRALVACDRCRKRKIKCNGDLDAGKACSSCLSVGATECTYNRVNSFAAEQTQREVLKFVAADPQARSKFLSQVPRRDEYNLASVQPGFTRQSVGMDSLHYDEQTANYHGQSSPSYMLSSNSNAMLDYSTAWGNRGWDPVMSRPGPGEYFDEQQQNTQAAYGYIQSMSAALPQSTGAGAIPYTEAVDRALPTPPSCRSQAQTTPTLLTLPENLQGMTLAPDSKHPFWNQHQHQRPMPLSSNTLYHPHPQAQAQAQARMNMKPGPEDTTPDLIFDMTPSASSAPNPPYPSLDTIESPLGLGFPRDGADGRFFPLTPECPPSDLYGYASDRKRKDASVETRCSASTLMGGLPYTRVRPAEGGMPFSYLLDGLPGDMHRSSVSPLGGHHGY